MNPLPIASCGAAYLRMLDPATKDRPRNPQGVLVSIADFDMTVTGATATDVAGEQVGPTNWSACACQGATVGSTATITASYPAKMLAEKARVPGVVFQVTAPLTIGKPQGAGDTRACLALKTQTMATRATPIGGGVRTAAPEVQPIGDATTAAALQRRAVVAGTGKSAPSQLSVTEMVEGLRVKFALSEVGSTLTSVDLFRKDGTGQSTKRGGAVLDFLACTDSCTRFYFDDPVADPRLTYQYVVVSNFADGTSASSPPIAWTAPRFVNPSGFTAQDSGGGKVAFQWRPVPGALRYRLDGPGVPGTELVVTDTVATLTKVRSGPATWKLTSLYTMNFADYTTSTLASTVVRAVPPHTVPWLSKKSGPGSDAITKAHYVDVCTVADYSGRFSNRDCAANLLSELKRVPGAINFYDLPQFQAVYGNPTDLGFGRRTSCAQGDTGPPGFLTTICWATSHGPGAGEAGFADPTVITQAATQSNLIRTTTVIIKDATGMRFRVFGPPTGGGGYDAEPSAPSNFILLDSEGKKFAPNACMACHGGTYDTATKRVLGASLLPLNPSELVFAGGPSGRAAQEESIRKINQYVVRAAPSAAVASYINGLYGGQVNVAGAKALDDYVPSGWSTQSGLYRQVVRPYCATCHLAAQPDYSFASWSNFQDNAAIIRVAVCLTHSMPHAEQPFKEFWTKNTGIVYLPGLLAASLGYESC
ncbi:MAG: hypothetical protein ABIP93_04720 [Gemmatimonadaceae bacterium]